MIPRDLSADYRKDLRAGFEARMNRAKNREWRDFWETEVLFLDNLSTDAVSRLRVLTRSEDNEVAVAALLSLGEWYEQSGSVALAHEAYAEVVARAPAVASSSLARAKKAYLHNEFHESALAVAVLENAAFAIENVPPDAVQFVVTEYCRALRDLGRMDDARMFIRRAIGSFPERIELPLLEHHLLDAPV